MRILIAGVSLIAVLTAFGPGMNVGINTSGVERIASNSEEKVTVAGPAYYVGGQFKKSGTWDTGDWSYLFQAYQAYGKPEFFAYYDGDHKLVVRVLMANVDPKVGTTASLTFDADSEHTIVAGVDADETLHLYVDGAAQELTLTGAGSGGLNPMPSTLYIGQANSGRYQFLGGIYNICQGSDYSSVANCMGNPGLDAGAPGLDAAQPGEDAAQPGLDAAAPGEDAGSAGPDAAVDVNGTSVAVSGTGPAYYVGGKFKKTGTWDTGDWSYLWHAYTAYANPEIFAYYDGNHHLVIRTFMTNYDPKVGTTSFIGFDDDSQHVVIAGVDSDVSLHLYVDGAEQELTISGNGSGGITPPMPQTLYIGKKNTGQYSFGGSIYNICQGTTYAGVAACIGD